MFFINCFIKSYSMQGPLIHIYEIKWPERLVLQMLKQDILMWCCSIHKRRGRYSRDVLLNMYANGKALGNPKGKTLSYIITDLFLFCFTFTHGHSLVHSTYTSLSTSCCSEVQASGSLLQLASSSQSARHGSWEHP